MEKKIKPIELPLSVLAYEGPQVRAYLSQLKQNNLKPKKIIRLILTKHPSTGKKIGRFFPKAIKVKYAAKSQDINHNFWPRFIFKKYPEIVNNIITEFEKLSIDSKGIINDILTNSFNYNDYASEVYDLVVDDINDNKLKDYLSKYISGSILYSGGGILNKEILSIKKINFIHIHPGYLPFIQGADGLLWSLILRGKTGLSAFYMKPKIDTGDIICKKEQSFFKSKIANFNLDDRTLYRVIFSFIDPILRANFLIKDVLLEGNRSFPISARKQNISQGCTFHFMHQKLLSLALKKIFKN